MAKNTDISYRNQTMYAIYVRNHTPEGTFEAVRRDLPRIRALGVDMIWLMPVQPIGVKGHKGTLGCPYAIRDYRGINPDYGTFEDFHRLVDECHSLGMKCILDVVYRHTSPDSVLVETHPEWFYRKPDGSFGGRVGDWSDVIDLDYSVPELWDYQIETLKFWAQYVDGFRCDVASAVPLEFWIKAREEADKVRPGCFWLAESVHPEFIRVMRSMGCDCSSDAELYQTFDLTYQYDMQSFFSDYLTGKLPLARYIEELDRQELAFPRNYIKLRYLENHDQLRAAFVLPDRLQRLNWTAFMFFQRGMALIYGGQEKSAEHLPSLFDRDPIDSSGEDCSELLRALIKMKRDPLLASGVWKLKALPADIVLSSYSDGNRTLLGVFSLKGKSAPVYVGAPDGVYRELIGGGSVEVKMGRISCKGSPVILNIPSACSDSELAEM